MTRDARMACYRRRPLSFTRGKGCRLTTAEGRSYLDLLSGIGVNALGHADPGLQEVLSEQLGKLVHVSNLYDEALQKELALRLTELCGMDRAFFCNSGTEAVEVALKIAARASHDRGLDRTRFLALEGSFHGRSLGSLSCTANPGYREPFAPFLAKVDFIPAGDIDALTEALASEQHAALIVEPIQGESGVKPLPKEFLTACRERSTVAQTALIFDEIQSGCGRSGSFLASQHETLGTVDAAGPDLVTLAKPLAAGLPIGACLATESYAKHLVPGDHGSTFGGGPLACRAALYMLEQLVTHGLLEQVQKRGAYLAAALDALVERHDCLEGRRGVGLMQALVLKEELPGIFGTLEAHGLLVGPAGPKVLRFLPPFVITEAEIDEAKDALDAVFRELA